MGKFTVDLNVSIKKQIYVILSPDEGLLFLNKEQAEFYSSEMLKDYKNQITELENIKFTEEELKKEENKKKNDEVLNKIKKIKEDIEHCEKNKVLKGFEVHEIGLRKKSYAIKTWIDNGSLDILNANSPHANRVRNFGKYEILTLRALLTSWSFEKEDANLKLEFENDINLGVPILTSRCVQNITTKCKPELLERVIDTILLAQSLTEEEEKK